MHIDFDTIINRYDTNSMKWDNCLNFFGTEDILPMWVADMDFIAAPPILDALSKRIEHGVFGYSCFSDSYYHAVINWMKNRHDWKIQQEWINFSTGVVPAINFIIQAFSQPGDQIIVQPPGYYPFFEAIKNNSREIIYNPLKYDDGHYFMDFEDLEKKIGPNVKILILCHPHNPVGRVWTETELKRLGQLCLKNRILVISDEIHADIIYKKNQFIPYLKIDQAFHENTIVCTSASKTFNLAGLQISNLIIPNKDIAIKYQKYMKKLGLIYPNIFGLIATEIAYQHGEEWHRKFLDYMEQNFIYLENFVKNRLKQIKIIKPEGTYLVWLDCRGLELNPSDLELFMSKNAKVGLDGGTWFGPGGDGFVRINIACSRATLEEGLKRIEFAINTFIHGLNFSNDTI